MSPPDAEGHSRLTVASAIEKARSLGLDFVILTAHDAHLSFPPSDATGPEPMWGLDLEAKLAREALAKRPDPPPPGQPVPPPLRPLLAVAGWEFTRELPGHLGVSFFDMDDVAKAEGDKKVEIALGKGAFVVVNHPFFRPVRSMPALEKLMSAARVEWSGDWRWKPFFGISKDANLWNGIEVWHERSVLVEKMHRDAAAQYPDTQMVRAALSEWDRATKAQRRRITAVGGSDCHGRFPYAIVPMKMTGVRIDEFTEEGLRKGLVGARVTFGLNGGLDARDFRATSDVVGERAGIGDSLRAKETVTLTWSGKAVLYEDGERAGEFENGAVRKLGAPGAFRFWRIEKPGDQFSNMIYANL